jgi:hypothetical protein
MTATVLDMIARPSILGPCPGDERSATDFAPGGGPTLEDVISGAWEGLAATRTAPCPICAGTLIARYGASGPGPVAGTCRDCGAELT